MCKNLQNKTMTAMVVMVAVVAVGTGGVDCVQGTPKYEHRFFDGLVKV